MKTLSIIVTTLNSKKKIQGFLNSILNQNTRDFSVIIVDGGSSDGTVDMIRKCDFPIHLIIKPGISIYGGLNYAIEVCNSDFYIVCGSDDELNSNAISLILYDITHKVDFDLYLYSIKKDNSISESHKPTSFRRILGWQSIVASHSVGCVINKELHEKFDYYSPKYKILADGYFLSKVLNSGTNVFVSKNVLGTFGTTGVSNKNFYENIFATFLIQIKFNAFFPQLILLIVRLIKYKNLSN